MGVRVAAAWRAVVRFVRWVWVEHRGTVGYLILAGGLAFALSGVYAHADDAAHVAKQDAIARALVEHRDAERGTRAVNGAVRCIKNRLHDAVIELSKVPPDTPRDVARTDFIAALDLIDRCRIKENP